MSKSLKLRQPSPDRLLYEIRPGRGKGNPLRFIPIDKKTWHVCQIGLNCQVLNTSETFTQKHNARKNINAAASGREFDVVDSSLKFKSSTKTK